MKIKATAATVAVLLLTAGCVQREEPAEPASPEAIRSCATALVLDVQSGRQPEREDNEECMELAPPEYAEAADQAFERTVEIERLYREGWE